VNENGEEFSEEGLTEPAPFSVIVTDVALVKVLPLIVTGPVPQVVPLLPERESCGSLAHPHETENAAPVDVHPALFLTVIV
jgi:hypothetical protein